jgi:hypothetical protein
VDGMGGQAEEGLGEERRHGYLRGSHSQRGLQPTQHLSAWVGAAERLPCAAGLLAVCFLRTREAADYFASR